MVTVLAIQRGFRVPDALFPHYPVVTNDPYNFTPSFLLSVNDDILSVNATRYILKSFMQNGDNPQSNYLLSPLIVDDKILA
jgi:hormone-sensitive lipase